MKPGAGDTSAAASGPGRTTPLAAHLPARRWPERGAEPGHSRERRVVQHQRCDALPTADARPGLRAVAGLLGIGYLLAWRCAPMLWEGRGIGAISCQPAPAAGGLSDTQGLARRNTR